MKKKIITTLFVCMLFASIAACGKPNIDKMSDAELYAYMEEMSEDEFNEWADTLTKEQWNRAFSVYMTNELTKMEVEDSFTE